MIARYTRPEMGAIWSEENQFRSWLEVELAACEAWAELGVIPRQDLEAICRGVRLNPSRIRELEEETRHDVVAFLRAIGEGLGPERKWIHYGLTSSDVVDTALAYRLLQANRLLREGLQRLRQTIGELARRYKYTPIMGRTHGVHAEPTSFGLKLAVWYVELGRQQERFEAAAETVRVGKLSGAVGTFAHLPPFVEQYVCRKLGLLPEPVATQVVQRDRHAHYVATLALIGASIEKIAIEIRHLQRTEVRELEEPFYEGQAGSSAMPHKRNPIGAENLIGCARLLRGYMLAAYENVALWHERDISHSSVERIILPDATILLDYMLHRLRRILEELRVYPERMRANFEHSLGLAFSQRVLLKLIEKGLSREEAYREIVQPLAMRAWQEGRPFRQVLEADERVRRYLSDQDIEEAFDLRPHLAHVDYLFERAGL